MKRIITTSIITICLSLPTEAQTYLDHVQSPSGGKGTVTVTQSKEIDALVNNTKCATAVAKTATAKTTATKNATEKANKPNTAAEEHHKAAAEKTPVTTQSTDNTEEAAPIVEIHKKVMRHSYKVNGYRVQVFAGGNSRKDRQKAENIGSNVKAHFPTEPIYVHFYSPRWICRVGNYRSYEEARAMLQKVRDLGYKQACIVKGKISVQY
jgi:hypothetical protein